MRKTVVIFEANMSSSVHIDKKGKYILILCEGTRQGLDDASLTAEAEVNFRKANKRFVLSLH